MLDRYNQQKIYDIEAINPQPLPPSGGTRNGVVSLCNRGCVRKGEPATGGEQPTKYDTVTTY